MKQAIERAAVADAAPTLDGLDEFLSIVAKKIPPDSQVAASILLRTYADGLRDMGMMQENAKRTDIAVPLAAP